METDHKEQFVRLLEHLCIEILPFAEAPGFTDSIIFTEDFEFYHSKSKELFQKLPKLSELGLQPIILGNLVSSISYVPDLVLSEGNKYPSFTFDYINSIYVPQLIALNEVEPKNQEDVYTSMRKNACQSLKEETKTDPSLLKFVNFQISSSNWFHDLQWYYTDASLNTNIKIVNFEVTKKAVNSVFEHQAFFKVIIGLLSYYPFLKEKLEMNCDEFCTSSVLIADSAIWILHFVIKKDQERTDVLKKLLYISKKYDLKQETDVLTVQASLQWLAERGLSTILNRAKSISNLKRTSNSVLTTSTGSTKISILKSFSFSEYKNLVNNLGTVTKAEALKLFAQLYPETAFEERIITKSEFKDMYDQTRLIFFATKEKITRIENNIQNNKRFLIFDKWKVLVPTEKFQQWKYSMTLESWNNMIANNSTRAFKVPQGLFEFSKEDELFIKLENNSDPFVLEKLTRICHVNVMKVIKIIEVENKFVATMNETLYPLDSIFDANNQYNRLNHCEIENILFCFKIIRDVWNGLKYLSNQKIFYKDISFNNIMLSQDLSTAKLIDFEACCREIEIWEEVSICTSVYTPNEPYDENSHIFSLVVLLCELVFMVLAQYKCKTNYPRRINYAMNFRVTKTSEIPSIDNLKRFIWSQFIRFFPEQIYYIQYFVDAFIVEKSERASARMFGLALSTWINMLSQELKLTKTSF